MFITLLISIFTLLNILFSMIMAVYPLFDLFKRYSVFFKYFYFLIFFLCVCVCVFVKKYNMFKNNKCFICIEKCISFKENNWLHEHVIPFPKKFWSHAF